MLQKPRCRCQLEKSGKQLSKEPCTQILSNLGAKLSDHWSGCWAGKGQLPLWGQLIKNFCRHDLICLWYQDNTDVPANSDTIGTRQKCHCWQAGLYCVTIAVVTVDGHVCMSWLLGGVACRFTLNPTLITNKAGKFVKHYVRKKGRVRHTSHTNILGWVMHKSWIFLDSYLLHF